jgi:hypothetical protein
MLSALCAFTGAPSCTQCCRPSLTHSRRRKCQTSVVVATVLLRPPRLRRCSMATVGGMPYTASTSGRPGRLHDAARIGVQAFQVAPLPFVEQDVEGQRALARAADAGDDVELAARDVDAQALQVVLARVDDADRVVATGPARAWRCARTRVCSGRPSSARRAAQAQRTVRSRAAPAGVRRGVRLHVVGRAGAHHLAAGLAAFGAEVDDPVGGADHVEVVLDHQQRMPGVQQLAQRAHQLGDVVEVQPGGGLVEQEQRARFWPPPGAGPGGLGQEAGQLQALRLAAAERGHRLAQAHVVQADVDDGLQPRHHLAVALEPVRGLGHGQVQHVGHAELVRPAHQLHVQHLGAVAAAVAVGAAQVDVGQELHLHVLEAAAAAGGAAAVAGVEAEGAGAVAALARQRRVGEELAQFVEGADVAGRVAARGLADRALVDEHRVGQLSAPSRRSWRPGVSVGLPKWRASAGTARPGSACSCPSR